MDEQLGRLLQFLEDRVAEDEKVLKEREGLGSWESPAPRVVTIEGLPGFPGVPDVSLKRLLESDSVLIPIGGVAVTECEADGRFMAHFDPERELREVEAKRAMLGSIRQAAATAHADDSLRREGP